MRRKGVTLLELILVMLTIAIVAGVFYAKVLNSSAPRISTTVLEMLKLREGIQDAIASRGVTDLGNPDFQNAVNSMLSKTTPAVGGSYSATFDPANDIVVLKLSGTGLSSSELQSLAASLARRICTNCSGAADPVSCCPDVSVSGGSVSVTLRYDE